MNYYRWYNELSEAFLSKDYLLPNQTLDQRVTEIGQCAEDILNLSGFSQKFKNYFARGWFSLSTPIWTNFGSSRGLPISCYGSVCDDSMASILSTHAEIGMQTKYGGGTSLYIGNLRPRGSDINKNGQSSGSVHFLPMFDTEISVISQGSCYVEGTEVLTNSGFKDFRSVLPEDLLAEVDDCNNVSFTDKYQMVVQDYTGDLVCLGGKKRGDSVSIKVTPNHRMVVCRRKMEDRTRYWPQETEIVEAQDLKMHRDNRLILGGWAGEGPGLTDEDRFRIAFQADGIKDGPNRKIRFHLSKARKINRLMSLLGRMGLGFDTYTNPGGTLDINIEYSEKLKKNTFSEWVCLDKISGTWAEEFLDELVHWDGAKSHGGALCYCSIIKDNVDVVQAVAALADKKTRVRYRKAYGNRQTLHNICISEGAYRGGEAVSIKYEPYCGKVYCAIVPKGRLIVRYKGRVMVCGNTRRGNLAVYQDIHHPDIMEFLQLRSEGNPIQDLSFGVCVYNSWLQQMIDGDTDKREVWARVLEVRRNTGYPYLFFPDNANMAAPDVYKKYGLSILHSNLCNEIALYSSSSHSFVCDLSSMNVLYYEEWKNTDAVEVLTFLLDAVMTEFIQKSDRIQFMERSNRFAREQRALGIGQLGWHSLLQSRRIPFESWDAKSLNVSVARTIQEQAHKASEKLASLYREPYLLEDTGRRNVTLTAIAPTKSSSFILGQASEGIEPIRSNYTIKDLAKGKFSLKNPYLQEHLAEKGLDREDIWLSILKKGGSVQHLPQLSQEEKDIFKTFQEISQLEVVQQAAQRQRWVDQGQSLNLMIPPGVSPKETNALILEGWRLGLKGFYYQFGVNAAQEFSRDLMTCSSCEA